MTELNRTSRYALRRTLLSCAASCLLWCITTVAPAQMEMPSVWDDPATGLSWAIDIDDPLVGWWSANSYCQALTTFKGGWRQPTLDELIAIWQGSHFKDGFAFASGNFPLWTSEVDGPNVKVLIPRSTGAVLRTLARNERNGVPSDKQSGVGVCVRKRRFWEMS